MYVCFLNGDIGKTYLFPSKNGENSEKYPNVKTKNHFNKININLKTKIRIMQQALEELRNFTRLKNGKIVYVVKRDNLKKIISGHDMSIPVPFLKEYTVEEEDELWIQQGEDSKLRYLKENFKPASFYGITNTQREKLTEPQRIHGILVRLLFFEQHSSL